jgi:hypothetical protein
MSRVYGRLDFFLDNHFILIYTLNYDNYENELSRTFLSHRFCNIYCMGVSAYDESKDQTNRNLSP